MEVWEKRKNPLLAIFYGKQAVNGYQAIRRNIECLDAQTQQAFLKSSQDTYRILANLLIAAGRLPEAQKVLGMLKEEEQALRMAQLSLLQGSIKAAPDEAERSARLRSEPAAEVIFVPDANVPYAHPYFWAPFVLIENWR